MRRHPVAVVLLAALACSTLAGCVDEYGIEDDKRGAVGVELTPEESRLAMIEAEDAAIAVVGGQWQDHDSFLPAECEVGTGEGVYFSGHRTRSDDASGLDEDAEAVLSMWEDAGYQVETRSYAATHRIVMATTANGLELMYTATEEDGAVRAGITADSACVAADFAAVRREYGERLKQPAGE